MAVAGSYKLMKKCYWNMALWVSEQNVGWMEWVMGDTPYTVMTTRVPLVPKIQLFNR